MEIRVKNESSNETSESAQYLKALDLLTRYLALRDHSRYELKTKLSRKYPPDIVERVLAEAEDRNWLGNEAEIMERAVRTWRSKLKSEQYIQGQLRKRRLPLPQQDTHVELETARTLLVKKFGEDLDFETKAKAFRYMKYRGFKDRIIRMVLNGQSE